MCITTLHAKSDLLIVFGRKQGQYYFGWVLNIPHYPPIVSQNPFPSGKSMYGPTGCQEVSNRL